MLNDIFADSFQAPRSQSSAGTGSPTTGSNAALYPWSQRRLNFTSSNANPFPRYGAAINSIASKEGDIYMMGGLIDGSTVKGDLWMVESSGGNLSCFPIPTVSEGPGPRVGHASLLVGNAFIVFGGDTKINDNDVLDDTLYLLNTCECLNQYALVEYSLTHLFHRFSISSMVSSDSPRSSSCRTIWPHLEHSWIQIIRLRRSG